MKLLGNLKELRKKITDSYNSLWALSREEAKKKELQEAMRFLGFSLNSLNDLILEEEINKDNGNNKKKTKTLEMIEILQGEKDKEKKGEEDISPAKKRSKR